MPYFAQKLFFPLNKNVRVVAISTTTFIPRININLSGSLDSNGTALPSAAGTPISAAMARDDANKIIVANNSASNVRVLHYSTNGGSTFTAHPTSNSFILQAAISDNGQFMCVAKGSGTGPAYYTYDGGSTWLSKVTPVQNPACVCCSSDGSKVFFGPGNTTISQASISTDSMATISIVTLPATGWYGACMTGDGSRIWIARNTGTTPKTVAYSDNNGSSWTTVTVDASAISTTQFIKCSKDGKHLICGASNADLYVSNNSGATWTKKTMTENVYGLSVNISSSGRYMVVVSTVTNGRFFYSKDFGATWQSKTISASGTQFRCIAIEEQTS